jgi:serine/threonine protein kinase
LGAGFVALDGELNSEVVLKQIFDHHADDQVSRTRFLLEAEITGGLKHPGIVPVYGLGHYGDGRPYYAMRFKLWKKLAVLPDATHRMVQIPDKRPCVSPKLANWTPMRSISER